MTEPNFENLLSMRADDVKPPPTLPAGTYHGVIASQKFGKSKEKQTDFVGYEIQFLRAGDDVEQSELGDINLSSKRHTANFYITPNSLFRLTEFFKSCGINTAGRSVAELIPEAVGKEVLIPVTCTPDKKDITKMRNEFGDVTGIGA